MGRWKGELKTKGIKIYDREGNDVTQENVTFGDSISLTQIGNDVVINFIGDLKPITKFGKITISNAKIDDVDLSGFVFYGGRCAISIP